MTILARWVRCRISSRLTHPSRKRIDRNGRCAELEKVPSHLGAISAPAHIAIDESERGTPVCRRDLATTC